MIFIARLSLASEEAEFQDGLVELIVIESQPSNPMYRC
jgi:hypothetical protein